MSIILKKQRIKYKDPDSGTYKTINAFDLSGEAVIPTPPSTNGTYTLRCTVSNGNKTYSWVSA